MTTPQRIARQAELAAIEAHLAKRGATPCPARYVAPVTGAGDGEQAARQLAAFQVDNPAPYGRYAKEAMARRRGRFRRHGGFPMAQLNSGSRQANIYLSAETAEKWLALRSQLRLSGAAVIRMAINELFAKHGAAANPSRSPTSP
jgi:hypothetical protein